MLFYILCKMKRSKHHHQCLVFTVRLDHLQTDLQELVSRIQDPQVDFQFETKGSKGQGRKHGTREETKPQSGDVKRTKTVKKKKNKVLL